MAAAIAHNLFTDVADSLERGLLESLRGLHVGDIGEEHLDEVRPLPHGKLRSSDVGRTLRE